ncbi:helix-turn-helix transcriptional regulator [Micromonospora lupini]|uniref:helix-turn-helix transcriptional regulator n=2 Tax=Micromonospora lupini TaxID=285679 RepID=UPI0031E17439
MTRRSDAGAQRDRKREQLRHFLQSRRARLTPEDVGLPGGGRRRTPGLRREEVAILAGVGVSWYTWLEQGRDITVSGAVLDGVSRALQLDADERVHLYRLAGLNPPQPAVLPTPSNESTFGRLVQGWLPNPAYLLGPYWDILELNRAAEVVFGLQGSDRNCLYAFFTNPQYRKRHRYWNETAPSLVAEFRGDAARFPDDPGFLELAERLSAVSAEFKELWARHDVQRSSVGVKTIDHPGVGCMRFDVGVLQLPDQPHVRLILHTPQSGTDTQQKLELLMSCQEHPSGVTLAPAF